MIKKLPDNFNDLRKNVENESYLSEMIRKDSVEDFIAYVHRSGISLNSKVYPSVYELSEILH